MLLAYRLQASRDIGAGLLQTRPGPPIAAPSLGRPEGLAIRLQRASFIGWALALALTGVAYGSVAQDVADLVGDNDTLEELIAQAGGSLVDSFFATSLLILALITGGFAVAATMRLRSEETAGRAEPLLATALPRTRWALSHLLVALAGSALIALAAGLGMGLTDAVISGSFSNVPSLIVGSLAFAPALWVLVGIAFALFGVLPRAMVAAWGALGAFFVIGMFGVLFKLPSWVIDLSPFQHVPAIPAAGLLGPAADHPHRHCRRARQHRPDRVPPPRCVVSCDLIPGIRPGRHDHPAHGSPEGSPPHWRNGSLARMTARRSLLRFDPSRDRTIRPVTSRSSMPIQPGGIKHGPQQQAIEVPGCHLNASAVAQGDLRYCSAPSHRVTIITWVTGGRACSGCWLCRSWWLRDAAPAARANAPLRVQDTSSPSNGPSQTSNGSTWRAKDD